MKTWRLILSLAICAAAYQVLPVSGDQPFRVTALSSRPDMVSGGDVLVQVDVPADVSFKSAAVKLNGQDVTAALHPDAQGHSLLGVVSGLKVGENSLEVFNGGSQAAKLALRDYPVTGPIFSGKQEQPFYCETQNFKLPDGATLGPPLDANCSVKTVVTYMYKSATEPSPAPKAGVSAAPALKPLPSLTALPADVAYTTTSTGEKVPYVVRIETGTINRAIYQIAVLSDPTKEPSVGPLGPPRAWNRRLLYSFGGGCPGGWMKQGTSIGYDGPMVKESIVGKGYAEASSTLNVFGNNCNSVLAAETMMMVKERFIKAIGKPDFTLSWGSSGGSEQQLPMVDNYPGLLDGIIPGRTFPDVLSNAQLQTDSQLLFHYYNTAGKSLTEEQRLAITGAGRVKDFTDDVNRIRSAVLCPAQLPVSHRYDPATNREGVRCDIFDHNVNIFGRDPVTGFARRVVDNTGVQYGLDALNNGKISAEQFLDLNQTVGGYDNDGNYAAARNVADPVALRIAYQKGQMFNGGSGLAQHPVPIIDVRPYRDMLLPDGDVHLKFHSFSLRARIMKANGGYANEVMLVGPVSRNIEMDEYAVTKMDEWLTNLQKDPGAHTMDAIVRAKPADLVDSCLPETGDRIAEPQTPTGGKCNELYPTYRSPRMVAGDPAANDILKCQLKSIDFGDYKATFTDAEKRRLAAIFPDGVCDWSKPGVEQQRPASIWISY